jgi:hypothetical protein
MKYKEVIVELKKEKDVLQTIKDLNIIERTIETENLATYSLFFLYRERSIFRINITEFRTGYLCDINMLCNKKIHKNLPELILDFFSKCSIINEQQIGD